MKDHVPEPMKVGKAFQSLTEAQKLQFDAVVGIVTALLIGVCQASQTEDRNDKINRKE